jgi:mutator protein MutT
MVGVVLDEAGRALIAQRTAGKHHAGGWEFPGGKLEAGEPRMDGLARELREELGIVISTPRPLIRVTHTYPYAQVLLDVWVIRKFSGRPVGLDGQALRWCPMRELSDANLLPADEPILAVLALPDRLTQATSSDYTIRELNGTNLSGTSEKLSGVLCATSAEAKIAARESADFLVLREQLPAAELVALCAAIDVPLFASGVELERAWSLGASGLNELGL